MAEAVLMTKIYTPPLRPGTVSRPRLIQRLQEGLKFGQPLTLISAPAGYGKTTLASEWLAHLDRPAVWVSLDEGDNDPVRFLTYLVVALQKVDPQTGKTLKSLLGAQKLPVEILVSLLINDLVQIPESFVLVLDDYHVIQSPFINQVMQYMLEHMPPNFHLVILTREDPPFPLARWRVKRQVSEVRVDDLRFMDREVKEFFEGALGLPLEDELARALENRTEGWAAGLQLAGLSLRGRAVEEIVDFVEAFKGSHRYVIDYLLEEVLNQQSEVVRGFLCKTAILPRLNEHLCDAVAGRQDSREILAHLEQANLFIVPLDEERNWFRYHHLFADFLRTELSKEEEAELHQKAFRWFLEAGYAGDAFAHACSAGDWGTAGKIITERAAEMLFKGHNRTLLKWMERLPAEKIACDADLTGYRASVMVLSGRMQEAAQCLQEGTFAVNQLEPLTRGRLLGVQAWLGEVREAPETLALAKEALALIGDQDAFLKAFVQVALARAYRKTGNMAASSKILSETVAFGERFGLILSTIGPRVDLAFDYMIQGRYREAEEVCRRPLEGMKDRSGAPLPYLGMLFIPLGVINFERDNLPEACDYLIKGIEICRKMGIEKLMGGDGERTLARVHYAMGETAVALSLLKEACAGTDPVELPVTYFRHRAILADLLLKVGDLAGALEWIKEASLSPADQPTSLREQGYFVYARILLAQYKLADALQLLDNLERFAREGGRNGRLITLCILKSLALSRLGEPVDDAKNALAFMEEAVTLAAPAKLYRLFLDEGPAALELAARVREAAPEFVETLLKKSKQFNNTSQENLPPLIKRSQQKSQQQEGLVEPLSERELEILSLMASGLSNNEIAGKLFITLGTTKWHLNNIYSKLGVRSRTQATVRARELNLI